MDPLLMFVCIIAALEVLFITQQRKDIAFLTCRIAASVVDHLPAIQHIARTPDELVVSFATVPTDTTLPVFAIFILGIGLLVCFLAILHIVKDDPFKYPANYVESLEQLLGEQGNNDATLSSKLKALIDENTALSDNNTALNNENNTLSSENARLSQGVADKEANHEFLIRLLTEEHDEIFRKAGLAINGRDEYIEYLEGQYKKQLNRSRKHVGEIAEREEAIRFGDDLYNEEAPALKADYKTKCEENDKLEKNLAEIVKLSNELLENFNRTCEENERLEETIQTSKELLENFNRLCEENEILKEELRMKSELLDKCQRVQGDDDKDPSLSDDSSGSLGGS